MRAVGRQRFLGVNEAAAFTNSSRPYFIEPDRAKDCEQPTVDPRSRDKLIGPLDRPQTRRLHEIVSHVPRLRQHERISPEACERRLELGAHFPSACFPPGLA